MKSRLGFGGGDSYRSRSNRDDYDDFDDEYADDDYDGYSEYGSSYQDDDGSRIEPYRPVSVRETRTSTSSTYPKLVSSSDVRRRPSTSTSGSYSSSSSATSYTSTRSTRLRGGERTVVDDTAPAPSTPAHNAAMRASQARTEAIDSLFQPTTPASDSGASTRSATSAPAHASASSAAVTVPQAPAIPSVAARPKARSLSVLKPSAYADVEKIAAVVRSGDVVVLALKDTPGKLAERILDFSFGVASALEANVESPASGVFAIAKGAQLTATEKQTLHTKGVL
ncbi:MAG: cell division protein SepF [Eggerthellaceae bacterium]